MITQDLESLKVTVNASVNSNPEGANNSEKRLYRKPEIYSLGSLEQVQLGSSGNNYDSSSRWWYYE